MSEIKRRPLQVSVQFPGGPAVWEDLADVLARPEFDEAAHRAISDLEQWLSQLSKRVASLEAKGPVDDRPAASKRVEDINTGLNDAVKKLEGLETWAQGIEDKHADLEAQAEQDNGAWRRVEDRVRVLEQVAAGDEILVRTPADEDRLRKENHILRKAAQVDAKKIAALREDEDRLRKRVRDLEEVNEKLLEENGLLGEKADRLNALALDESSARMRVEEHAHALREENEELRKNANRYKRLFGRAVKENEALTARSDARAAELAELREVIGDLGRTAGLYSGEKE